MAKQNRKLTTAEKAAKKRKREQYMRVFLNGKQKWVRRPQLIDGIPEEEFVLRNADPIWLQENGMWEYIDGGT